MNECRLKSVFSLSASFKRWSLKEEEEAITETVNRVSLQTALTEGELQWQSHCSEKGHIEISLAWMVFK